MVWGLGSHLISFVVKTIIDHPPNHHFYRWYVYASGWKTARVDVLLFAYGGWVGWGGILKFMYLAYIRGCYAAATSLVRGWVGWGEILTFMYLAYIRGCYAAATSQTWSQKHLGDRRCPMLP